MPHRTPRGFPCCAPDQRRTGIDIPALTRERETSGAFGQVIAEKWSSRNLQISVGMSSRRGERSPGAIETARAEHMAKCAEAYSLQLVRPGWVVIWSGWRREFTTFCCFAPDAVVLDRPEVVRLVAEIDACEALFDGREELPERAAGDLVNGRESKPISGAMAGLAPCGVCKVGWAYSLRLPWFQR